MGDTKSFWKMGSRILVGLLVIAAQILAVFPLTDSNDLAALNALKSSWNNLPPNWVGADPCGRTWDGVNCTNTRVTSLMLAGTGLEGSDFSDISSLTAYSFFTSYTSSHHLVELKLRDLSNNIGLTGNLPPSIGSLINLTILLLVGCSFSGPIPDSIGSLPQLVFLSLNSNSFTGSIPPSIGNLSLLSWLGLSQNKLTATSP